MDLKELLGRKKTIDPDEKDAKIKAIKEMRGVASDMMGDGIKDHMAKATVVARNPRELEEGLDKAKQVVSQSKPMMEEAEEEMHDDLDGDDEEHEPMEHVKKVEDDQDEHPELDDLGEEENEGEEESDDHPMVDMIKSPEHADEMIKKILAKKAALTKKA